MADDLRLIEHLKIGERGDVAGCQLLLVLSTDLDRHLLIVLTLDDLLEADLLEIKNDICHILNNSGYGGKLMSHAGDLDGIDGKAHGRGEENTTQSIT